MADSLAGAGQNQAAVDRRGRFEGLAGVVLAAGEGRRLRPLTDRCPKALCPVGNVALVDLALDRLDAVTGDRAVNVHHGRELLEAHLDQRYGDRVHRSIEEPAALGTAGALGRLRPWIEGRGVAVLNADAWSDADLVGLVAGWDGERVRLLTTGPFGPQVGIVASLLPWADVAMLAAEPSGLYEAVWRRAHADGRLETVAHRGRFIDCGTPADYLRANVEAADAADPSGRGIVDPSARIDAAAEVSRSVVGAGTHVDGAVQRCVLWAGADVAAGERLTDVVRTPEITVAA